VAGALYAHYVTFISPSTFGFPFSVSLVTMVVLGGMASLWGALAGSLFLTFLPEFLRSLPDFLKKLAAYDIPFLRQLAESDLLKNLAENDILIYGAILVLCMMFLPGGLAEGVRRLCVWLGRCLPGRTKEAKS
jgi:branched-chain amino acid transport system permease protein